MNSDVLEYFRQQKESGVNTIYLSDSILPTQSHLPSAIPTKRAMLNELYTKCKSCTQCVLHTFKQKTVFGSGNPDARIMFIGEYPEIGDDVSGKPFTGEAGALLTKIIENGMKLKREEVFVTTILKCPPIKNKTPKIEELRNCLPFLLAQIEIVKPDYICSLGRMPAILLLSLPETTPVRELRQTIHKFGLFKLLVTYSPYELMQKPEYKKDAWSDLQILINEMKLAIPKKEQ
jgi:DNA polymerase